MHIFICTELCASANFSSSRIAFLTVVARVAECLVSLGCLAHKAVVSITVVVHAVSNHIVNLRAVSESVGEEHRADDGVVDSHGARWQYPRRSRHGCSTFHATAAAASATSRVDGRSTRASNCYRFSPHVFVFL